MTQLPLSSATLLLSLYFVISLVESNGLPSYVETMRASVSETSGVLLKEQEPRRTAETAFREGKDLFRQGTAESLRKSIERLEEAFQLWAARNDKHGQALALNDIGLSLAELGNYQKALEYYERALAVALRKRQIQ